MVTHALRGEGFDASEDGTGRGTPIVPVAGAICRNSFVGGAGGRPEGAAAGHFLPVAFDSKGTEVQYTTDGSHPTLRSMGHNASHQNAGGHAAVSFAENSRAEIRLCGGDGGVSSQLTTGGGKPGQGLPTFALPWTVRRLTPRECERLQGFPDDFTSIPTYDGWRRMDETETPESCEAEGMKVKQTKTGWWVNDPDGPRYKALGNSMAVNVMEWLGERIAIVDAIEVAV